MEQPEDTQVCMALHIHVYVFTLLEIKIHNVHVVQNSSFLWTFVGNDSDVLIV